MRVPGIVGLLRNHEGLMGPSDGLPRELDFFAAQGFTMRLGGVGPVGRTLADAGLADDQAGLAAPTRLGLGDGVVHGIGVVPIHRTDHVPAVGAKALRGVVHKPRRHLAVDGDAVVVVQGDELVQLPSAGQGAGFMADAFHEAAVTQEGIGVVVHDGVARLVEFGGEQLLGQRHAHGVGDALAQRAGGRFHARRDADLRMAWGLAVQLAEVAQFVHRQRIAGQVQQGIDQHRSVTVAQHEAVAVGPMRVLRVVSQVAAPQRHGHLGHAHRGTGVAGLGLLHGVHGQCANRVGHQGGVGGGTGGGGGHGVWAKVRGEAATPSCRSRWSGHTPEGAAGIGRAARRR